MAYTSFAELLDVFETGPDEFTSTHKPASLGNNPALGFGGCTTGFAVMSAFKTVTKPNFHVYSVLGAFHGPTRTDRPVICRVTRTRDTRTFATRRVVAYQKQDNGSERTSADMLIDFHVLEQEMMKYSAIPSRDYGRNPEDQTASATGAEIAARLVKEGEAPHGIAEQYAELFFLQETFVEVRSCFEGVSAQTLHGLVKHIKTTQEHLPITEKASAEWMRTRQPLSNEAENTAALVCEMDGALSPLPLVMDHKDYGDTGACSTLDFAVRIMVPGIQMHKWHLRERKTIAAAVGRSYSESRLWSEDGTLVVVANQSSILRPRFPKKAKI